MYGKAIFAAYESEFFASFPAAAAKVHFREIGLPTLALGVCLLAEFWGNKGKKKRRSVSQRHKRPLRFVPVIVEQVYKGPTRRRIRKTCCLVDGVMALPMSESADMVMAIDAFRFSEWFSTAIN